MELNFSFLFLLTIIASTNASDNTEFIFNDYNYFFVPSEGSCRQEQGICVPLIQCPIFQKTLRTYHENEKEYPTAVNAYREYIKTHHCGYEGTISKVCCPFVKSEAELHRLFNEFWKDYFEVEKQPFLPPMSTPAVVTKSPKPKTTRAPFKPTNGVSVQKIKPHDKPTSDERPNNHSVNTNTKGPSQQKGISSEPPPTTVQPDHDYTDEIILPKGCDTEHQIEIIGPTIQTNANNGASVNINTEKDKIVSQTAVNVNLNLERNIACGVMNSNKKYWKSSNAAVSYPWLALLEYKTAEKGTNFLCGGTLITDRFVLTAARCVTSQVENLIKVRLGENDITSLIQCTLKSDLKYRCRGKGIVLGIESIIVHEGYNSGIEPRIDTNLENDIALVKLKHKVRFNKYIQPICLPMEFPKNTKFITVGWNKSMIPRSVGFNNKVTSVVVDAGKACIESNRLSFASEEHICVVKASNDSWSRNQVCVSDGGGPLMGYEVKCDGIPRVTLFGVSSLDLVCPGDFPYGLYTRVNDYMPWINRKLQGIH